MQIERKYGLGFLLGQADKKALEAVGMFERGNATAARQELLGSNCVPSAPLSTSFYTETLGRGAIISG